MEIMYGAGYPGRAFSSDPPRDDNAQQREYWDSWTRKHYPELFEVRDPYKKRKDLWQMTEQEKEEELLEYSELERIRNCSTT